MICCDLVSTVAVGAFMVKTYNFIAWQVSLFTLC